jgi:predicted MFS family arabinose efflux permease
LLAQVREFKRNAKLYLVFVLLINAIVGSTNVLYGLYIMQIGFTEDFYGRIVAIKTIAIGISAIPCGFFCERFGPVRSLRLATILIFLSNIMQFVFIDKYIILAGSMLSGFGFALVFVNESPFIMRNSTYQDRVHLFSYNFVAIMLSFVYGSFVSGLVSDILKLKFPEYISMRIALLLFTIVSFFAIIPVTIMSHSNNHENGKRLAFRDLKKNSHSGITVMIGFAALIGLGAGMVIPFFNIFLSHKLGIEDYQVGSIMSANQAAIILGTLLIPRVVSRFGKINAVIICQMLSVPFLVLIATPPNMYLVTFAFLMRGSLMCMAYPLTQNIAMEQVDDAFRPIFASLLKVFDNLSRGIGSFIGGWVMKNISYEFPYYVTALLYLGATLLFAGYFKAQKNNVENVM